MKLYFKLSKHYIYIAGRAEYFGNLIPGKAIPFWSGMFFPLLGKEVRNQTFEVLVTDNPGVFRWVPASSGIQLNTHTQSLYLKEIVSCY